MRLTAFLAGLLLSALIFVNSGEPAQALTPAEMALNKSQSVVDDLITAQAGENNDKPAKASLPSRIVKHRVKPDETLTIVADRYGTTWQRLFAKNTQIEHPDIIAPDDELIIPAPDERLEERKVPARPPESPDAIALEAGPTAAQAASQSRNYAAGLSAGNRYAPGYCTWYVKNRRPDLPNNLGDANTWVSRARAQGIPTGNAPRAGAVGQQGMHVVYVESVNGDGTVTVSEMNFRGWNVVSSRTVAAGNFQYIY